ncbi:hypothetical protein EUTSA_v10005179mg [Eutrema salsugineum]|uniref:Uncharacterized protein n=1 Tax=Eutrema salsugineum TaxID=72664 RepID=V4MKX4_EUTSA|nr:hypothetical protein EUTSA_v10005179mg [Eutrema salsugineum]
MHQTLDHLQIFKNICWFLVLTSQDLMQSDLFNATLEDKNLSEIQVLSLPLFSALHNLNASGQLVNGGGHSMDISKTSLDEKAG